MAESNLSRLIHEGQRTAYLPFLVGIAMLLSGWFAALTSAGAQFTYLGTVLVLIAILLSRTVWMVTAGLAAIFFGLGGPFILLYYLS